MSEAKQTTAGFKDVLLPLPGAKAGVGEEREPAAPPDNVVLIMFLQERQEFMHRRTMLGATQRPLCALVMIASAMMSSVAGVAGGLFAVTIFWLVWVTNDAWYRRRERELDKVIVGHREDADRYIRWKWSLGLGHEDSLNFFVKFEPYLWLALAYCLGIYQLFQLR